MLIIKEYISPIAQQLLESNPLAKQAYDEISCSIRSVTTNDTHRFVINNSLKNCNGVVPIKEQCYRMLEEEYFWFREKPLLYLHDEAHKGGPIDVYKELRIDDSIFCAGLEFETGNISSSHRSMNKLLVGIIKGELNLAVIMMPMKKLSYYLTDRVSNFEEIAPYFLLLDQFPMIVLGFDAEEYSPTVPLLPKGSDGMSARAIRKWRKA